MKTPRIRFTVLGIMAAVASVALVVGAWVRLARWVNGTGLPVVIVVPRAYRGEFRIVEVAGGEAISHSGAKYVYVIPPNGILAVDSLAPFQAMHIQIIEYDDGMIARTYDDPAHAATDNLAVFGSRAYSGYLSFFAGRKSDTPNW